MASSDAPVYSRFTSALKAPATSLAFAADGVLVAAGFDKLLKVYDPPLKRMLFTVPAPAPISSISYESQPIVGLMDGSLAAVQLDVPASKGAITKRSTVAATGQDATSLAVKQIFVIPSPPKRSRSAKPKDSLPEQASKLVSRKESDDDFLASIDDLVNNARAARRPPSGAQVFSPVSKRSPTPSLSESPSKAASFTEKNTERDVSTPRSRSVHAFTTLEDVSPGERENNDPSPNVGRIPGMMHSKDGKDDLHSIIAKPSEDDGPVQKASVQVCASQLQGSTASEDQIYTAPLESCDSHKTVDHNAEGQRSFPIHFPETASAPPYGSQAFNIPKEDIDNSSQSAITSDDMLTSFSVPSSIRRSLSGSNKELAEPVPDSARGIVADILQLRPRSERPPREQDGSTHIGILRNREGHSKGDESGAQATGSSSDATAERSYPSAADLAESVREVVRQELDVVKTDLRSDILNIHSELILLTARQSEELRTVVKERDQTILQLGKDVERLISDNTRLRQKYGLSS